MKHIKQKISLLSIFLAFSLCVCAQSVEKIEKKCKGLEYDKRIRIAVGSFKATTNSAYGKFAGELSTMLSNALVMTECFQVLASTKSNVMADIKEEKAFQQSADADPDATVASGKMLGAQLLITGEITEFKEGKEGFTAVGIGVTKNTAKVGFILQIVSPQTRQILFSESINADAISLGGFNGLRFFGLPAIGSFKTKAMADAVEKAIIKSVELIVVQKDAIPALPASDANDTKTATVKIEKVDYAMLGSITKTLKENPKVKDALKELNETTGTIKVSHTGTLEELADYLLEKRPEFKIVAVEKGQIALKPK